MTQQGCRETEFDIVIVGAGAIGSALALQLSALDYTVAVVDVAAPSYASSDPERVIALSYGSRCYLEGLGVWQDIAAAGLGLIRHIDVSEAGGSGRAEMDVSEAELLVLSEWPAIDALGYVVEMGQVLKPLHDKMACQVSLFAPVTIENIRFGDGREPNELYIQDGKERHCLKSPLLVGSDGTCSQIRLRAGIGTKGWDYNRFGLVLSAEIDKPHQDIAYECFRESGPLAFLPMADGRFSIVWALAPSEAGRLLQMPEMMFIRKLERAAGRNLIDRFGPIRKIGQRFCFPLELTIAEKYAKPGLALAGNAAHTIHPVAGQGMNLGFRDAAILAAVLSDERAHANPGAPILMQAYAEKRRADVLAVAGFTESMLNTFGISLPAAKQLRGHALDTLQKLSSVRSLLLGQAAGIAQMDAMSLPGESRRQV